jgi:hypothetical protein
MNSSRIKKKKGQVTIFVILGLILIIGIGLFIYLRNRTIQPTNINIPRLEGDAGQVQLFVESCIDQVGREGIIELGRHGGYIDPTSRIYTPLALKYDIFKQTESDMTFLNQNDYTTGIPYWYYSKSTSGCWHCDVSSLSPTPSLMEDELSTYVDRNLNTCLNHFQSFKEQGLEIVETTNSTTTTNILDSSVGFLTDYTIKISKNGEVKYIDKFYKEVDIPLLQYYMIAVNITQNEIDNEYLDFYALYLLGQYNDLDSTMLPPISSYRAGYDPVFWSKTNVRRQYSSLLNSYTQFFRVVGTKNDINYSKSANTIETKMYNAMRLPMFSDADIKSLDLKNKEINHIYLDSQVYLDVLPSKGDLVSPFVTKDTSPFSKSLGGVSPDQNYDFFYDISYPVVVEIKDDRPGKEYTFMFALQSNIKENKFISDWLVGFGTIPWSNDYIKMYSNIPAGTVVVDSETGENITYEPLTATKKFFCDANQRVSGNIKLRTYDSVTNMPLSDVTLTHYCGTYASCYIDLTRYNATLNESSINTKLPLCINGYVQLEREGYLTKTIPLTTEYDKSNNLGSIYMEPVVSKNISIMKYDVIRLPNNKYELGALQNISANDSVLLTLNKITFDQFEEPWTKTIILGRDGFGKNVAEVDLVAGAYTVSAQLLDYNGVIIPKKCQRIRVKGDDIYVPDNDIKIDVAMWGGISFNESNPFVISTTDLLGNNSLEIYVVRMPDPRCLDDMSEPLLTGYMGKMHRPELIPKFK